jgi:ABC-type multidrug transport system permease subunit
MKIQPPFIITRTTIPDSILLYALRIIYIIISSMHNLVSNTDHQIDIIIIIVIIVIIIIIIICVMCSVIVVVCIRADTLTGQCST